MPPAKNDHFSLLAADLLRIPDRLRIQLDNGAWRDAGDILTCTPGAGALHISARVDPGQGLSDDAAV